MACQMARYGGLLEVLGDDRFNRLFSAQVGQLMNIGHRIPDKLQPMRYFVDFTEAVNKKIMGEEGNRPVKTGQVVAFDGVSNYGFKKPYSQWKAHSTICIDDTAGAQKFVSVGTDPEGETESEICQNLLDEYNKEEDDPYLLFPENDEMVKNMKQLSSIFGEKNASASMKKLFPQAEKVGGYHPGTPQDFIIEIISDLMKLPHEQISMEFVKTHNFNRDRFKDE